MSRQIQSHGRYRVTADTESRQIQRHGRYRVTADTESRQIQSHGRYRVTADTEDHAEGSCPRGRCLRTPRYAGHCSAGVSASASYYDMLCYSTQLTRTSE